MRPSDREAVRFGHGGVRHLVGPAPSTSRPSLAQNVIQSSVRLERTAAKVHRGRSRPEEVFAMSVKRHSILISFAILGLSLSTGMQIAKAQISTLVCEGEFAGPEDCDKSKTGVFVQGVPLGGQRDCTNTCRNHGGYTHTPCGTIDSFAAKICGKPAAGLKQMFPKTEGNQCGYMWVTVICP